MARQLRALVHTEDLGFVSSAHTSNTQHKHLLCQFEGLWCPLLVSTSTAGIKRVYMQRIHAQTLKINKICKKNGTEAELNINFFIFGIFLQYT